MKTIVGAHKNHQANAILSSTHNKRFHNTKIMYLNISLVEIYEIRWTLEESLNGPIFHLW